MPTIIRSAERPGQPPTRAALLRRIALFSELSEDDLKALAQRSVEKRYTPGEQLFFEGESCRGLYLLIEGAVKISKTSPSGREVMLALITAPSGVAEVTVFDGEPYPASAIAAEPSVALFIDARDFFQLCHSHPAIAWQALRVVGHRLRQLVSTIERISFGSVRQRLATQLLEFGSDHFTLPITHQELASRLGTVREVITRNLGRFQAEKLIEVAGRDIRILNRDGLQREAETELS